MGMTGQMGAIPVHREAATGESRLYRRIIVNPQLTDGRSARLTGATENADRHPIVQ
jgi:hypothetical protein